MNIIKLGFISVVVFGGMFLIFTLLMPSHVRVSRAMDLHADSAHIEQAIKELRSSDSGFVYQSQVIPFDTITTLQLYYDFYLKWYNPADKLGSIVYDKQLAPVIEKYLLEIKRKTEK